MAIDGRSDSAPGKIKYGMVGGGEGAFIGAVHRLAARMDDHYELVAGALSSQPEKAIRSAKAIGIAADRSYGDYASMAVAGGSTIGVRTSFSSSLLNASIAAVAPDGVGATQFPARFLISATGSLFSVAYTNST